MTRIMYVCDLCEPECCGHEDRADLRVWSGDGDYAKTTLCKDCWEDWRQWHGNLDARPEWDALPMPSERVPSIAVTTDFDGWWNVLLYTSRVSGLPVNHKAPEAYRQSFDDGMTPYGALQADAEAGL